MNVDSTIVQQELIQKLLRQREKIQPTAVSPSLDISLKKMV
jgi:hypothetical protein